MPRDGWPAQRTRIVPKSRCSTSSLRRTARVVAHRTHSPAIYQCSWTAASKPVPPLLTVCSINSMQRLGVALDCERRSYFSRRPPQLRLILLICTCASPMPLRSYPSRPPVSSPARRTSARWSIERKSADPPPTVALGPPPALSRSDRSPALSSPRDYTSGGGHEPHWRATRRPCPNRRERRWDRAYQRLLGWAPRPAGGLQTSGGRALRHRGGASETSRLCTARPAAVESQPSTILSSGADHARPCWTFPARTSLDYGVPRRHAQAP